MAQLNRDSRLQTSQFMAHLGSAKFYCTPVQHTTIQCTTHSSGPFYFSNITKKMLFESRQAFQSTKVLYWSRTVFLYNFTFLRGPAILNALKIES
jgi:hypothetical protein